MIQHFKTKWYHFMRSVTICNCYSMNSITMGSSIISSSIGSWILLFWLVLHMDIRIKVGCSWISTNLGDFSFSEPYHHQLWIDSVNDAISIVLVALSFYLCSKLICGSEMNSICDQYIKSSSSVQFVFFLKLSLYSL